MVPILLPVLLAIAFPVDPPRFEASFALGAGYDGNLALAPDGSPSSTIGTTTLSVLADGGWSLPLGVRSRGYAGLRYDGVLCLDVSDFSRHVPGVDLAFTHVFNHWLAAFVSATGGYAFYGDSARSGPRLSARAVLRFRPLDRLSIRIGYGRTQNWASDPVFSLGTDRLLLNAEVQVARRTHLGAGYTFSTGPQVFYQSVTTPVPGRGNAHRGSGSFSTLVPYQSDATEHTFMLRAEQGFGSAVFVAGTFEHTNGSAAEGSYVVNSVFGVVGYRF